MHFKGYTRTIHHESSKKGKKNSDLWTHPDLVSVHPPFEDYESQTVELGCNIGQTGIRLFSFEMKIGVSGSNVREYFFQAVSNSSWANEGYLVALTFDDDALDQLASLSASFGIGVIRLDPDDVHQSEILFQSRSKDRIDLSIVDRLIAINPDFKAFVQSVNNSMKIRNMIKADYDPVMGGEDLQKYVSDKGICG